MSNFPLNYNDFVRSAFMQPKYIASKECAESALKKSTGGDRETGVEFKLFLSPESHLNYVVYGSPYAIAAGEHLCLGVAENTIKLGDKLDLEQMKSELDMPYNYFYILLALEDAWISLSE